MQTSRFSFDTGVNSREILWTGWLSVGFALERRQRSGRAPERENLI
jgi:hypothetical protein